MHPFFFIKKKISFLEKITQSNFYFPKHIIRAKIEDTIDSKNLKSIDNYSKIEYITITKKRFGTEGKAFFSKSFIFRSKFLANTHFESFLKTYTKKNSFAFGYQKAFSNVTFVSIRSCYLLFSKNGGYKVICGGCQGFLPKNQAKYLFKDITRALFISTKKKRINFDRSMFLLKNYFILRLPFTKTRPTFKYWFRRRTFCKSRRKKRFKFRINYIFIVSIALDKAYHNKKKEINKHFESKLKRKRTIKNKPGLVRSKLKKNLHSWIKSN